MIFLKILVCNRNNGLGCMEKSYRSINLKMIPLNPSGHLRLFGSRKTFYSGTYENNIKNIFPVKKFGFFARTEGYYEKYWTSFVKRKFSGKFEKTKVFNKNFSKKDFKRLLSLAKPEKSKISGAICLLIISSIITMAVPFSLGKVIDIIQITNSEIMREKLSRLSILLIGLFILGGLANCGRVFLMSIAGQNMNKNLCQKVFHSILNQEISFFDKTKTGELVNRLSADTALVCRGLTQNVSDGLRSVAMVLGGIFIMAPKLAIVGLSVVPPIAALAIVYGRFVKKMTKQVQDSLASATSIADERISNIRTVKAFSHENKESLNYELKLDHVLELQKKEALARGVFFGMAGLSGNAIALTVLYYGGLLVSENTMTIGSLTSFLLYASYVGLSIAGLSNFYSEINKSLGASIRLWEIIDRVPYIPLEGLKLQHEPQGFISFKNVTFSYPTRKNAPILKKLDLEVPVGTVTAIVGSSGSGKSTIASLLLRFYDPDQGDILLDGIKIDKIAPSWLRRKIGYVSQEPVLFSGTIRENILYGTEDISTVTEEQLIKVTKEANCFDFITKNFAEGFDTRVGERGVMLSGGQKQRIAIARALIKNPRILLLDEATSALDAESEYYVQEALEKIMKGRTVFIIAHRLSSIKNSDQIVVLEQGQIVEKGRYEDLIANEEGPFKKLIKHQAFL